MSIKRISTEDEDKLINNVKEAIALSNNGVSPSSAIAKVATDNNYNKDFAERMVNMFNTSKTLAHFKDNKGAKRAENFETANIEDVMATMYPDIAKVAEAKEIISGKDFMSIKPDLFTKAASESKPKAPYYQRDINPTISSALGAKYKFASDIKEAKTQLSKARDEQANTFAKVAEYFRRPGGMRFDEVDTKMRGTYKQAGELVMDAVWDFLGNWQKHEKRGSYSERVTIIDRDRTPFTHLMEALEKTEKVAECTEVLKKLEKESIEYSEAYSESMSELRKVSSGNTLYISADDDEVDTEAVEPECEPEENTDIEVQDDTSESDDGVEALQEQYVIEVEVKEAAEKASMDFGLGMIAEKALGALDAEKKPENEKETGVMSNLPETEVENIAADFSDDIKHLQSSNTIQDLMTYDTIISEYEPEEVLDVYNELIKLHPDISNQPAVLRSYLRRYLESSHDPGSRALETFDAVQLASVKPGQTTKPPEPKLGDV